MPTNEEQGYGLERRADDRPAWPPGWEGLALDPLRVGLVERDVLVRGTLDEFMSALGYPVSAHRSLSELLAAPGPEAPGIDLLLAELIAASPQHTRALRELQARRPALPVIALADLGGLLPLEEALACGVHGYLRKPVSLYELELTLLRMGERRAERAYLDKLTGLRTPYGFEALAAQHLRFAGRTRRDLSYLSARLSSDDAILPGDPGLERERVIADFAGLARETFRDSDILGRLEPTRFGFLLLDADRDGGARARARLDEQVEVYNQAREQRAPLQIELGVACYDPEEPVSLEELMAGAA